MTGFRALAAAQLKAFTRDRMLIFWTILFPLMFLVLFGGIFTGGDSANRVKVTQVGQVALFDQMPPAARAEIDKVIELDRVDDLGTAMDRVRKGERAGAIAMQGGTVTLYYSAADQVKAGIVRGTFDSIVNGANIAISGQPPALTLKAEQVEDRSLKAIQYVTPGLLAWAVSMGAVFGGALTLVMWRKSGLLRRLRLSPVSTSALVLSRSLITIILALLQLVIFLGVGMLAFGLRLSGSWWAAVPLLILGSLAFQAIGLVVGAVSKTEEAASGMANLVVMPMAFLSGSFIPLDSAPDWLRTVSNFLPMGHLNKGMSAVMVRGEGPAAILVPSLVLIGFTVVFSLLAARLFRWEE
ncbi:MAG TPA: ABC transporter permease [Dermatophilaceae bacterium]|nr:ABC transporter permease [Dermatophilaceae bacterium]